MHLRIREVFDRDLVENLEFLREEAIELGRSLRARRNQMRLNPIDFIKDTVQKFFSRVRAKDDLLGVARVTRILRHRAGEVFGLDPSAGDAKLEPAISWFDTAVENIEHELDQIDRKRVLWMTPASTIAAALAAIFSAIAIVIALWSLVCYRS